MPTSSRALLTLTIGGLLASCQSPALADDQPPADGWVVWQSNREDAQVEIYLGKADGTGVTRLTHTVGGAQQPKWAPDGRWIAYATMADNATHLVRWDGSEDKLLTDAAPAFWLHDNSGLVCQRGEDYLLFDPESGSSKLLFKRSEFPRLQGATFLANGITHEGRYLVVGSDLFRNGYTADNGSFKAGFAAVILDFQAKERVYFFGSGCWPFTPPAGDLVFHICGDCPTKPDIYRMDLRDLATRSSYAPETAHPDADWGHEYNPHVSNDNAWIAYMASTGCHSGFDCDYEIFLHRLGAPPDSRVRVTNNTAFDGYPDIFVGTPGAVKGDGGSVDAGPPEAGGPDAGAAGPDGASPKPSGGGGCALEPGPAPLAGTTALMLLPLLLGLLRRRGAQR